MSAGNSANDSLDLGGFTVKQWKDKRETLKNSLDYSPDWEIVVDWKTRRGRWFKKCLLSGGKRV